MSQLLSDLLCGTVSLPYRLVIIIVSWNVRQLLANCLDSIQAGADGIPIHTVVVDNASIDGSAELVQAQFGWVDLITATNNLGFARANNLALKRFSDRADYFLLLNPDTVLEPGSLRVMVEFMDSHPMAGIAGCKVVKPDGTLDWACKRSYIIPSVLFYKAVGLDRMYPNSPRFGRYQLTYLDENAINEVDALMGAFMMIRRQCLRAIGPLDESLFMYGEDLDWCYHAKADGWKVYYVPKARILHLKGQSSRKLSFRMIYYWYHSTWRTYQKWISPKYSTVVNSLVWVGFHAMCAVSILANWVRSEKRVPGRR